LVFVDHDLKDGWAGWVNPAPVGVSNGLPPHGGNLSQEARRLGMQPSQLLDASASLVPFRPPRALRRALSAAIQGQALRDYPDRAQADLRSAIASWHGVDPDQVLGGNGAAELFTWAARDATAAGLNVLPQPGFADYSRALACWGGAIKQLPLPLEWGDGWPQPFPLAALNETSDVIWITNPHNPTGQLWSRCSLEPLLARYALVICDEAFLPLVPGGEDQSLLPLVARPSQSCGDPQSHEIVCDCGLASWLCRCGSRSFAAMAWMERSLAGEWAWRLLLEWL